MRFLVLGGSSKVWRITAPYWFGLTGADQTNVASRSLGVGIDRTINDIVKSPPSVDVVIALWGVTSGSEKDLNLNTSLARDALEIAKQCGASLLLQTSTGAVYPPSEELLSEDVGPAPRNAYGRSKRNAETVQAPEGIKVVNLRLGNVAGADALSSAVKRERKICLDQWPDGRTPERSYIAPDDLAQTYFRLASQAHEKLPSFINVAGPRPVSMSDLLWRAGRSYSIRVPSETALRQHVLDTRLLETLSPALTHSSDPQHLVKHMIDTGKNVPVQTCL